VSRYHFFRCDFVGGVEGGPNMESEVSKAAMIKTRNFIVPGALLISFADSWLAIMNKKQRDITPYVSLFMVMRAS